MAGVAYPVHVRIAYVERRSRLTSALRFPLVVPHLLVLVAVALAAAVVTVLAWIAILVTGRNPSACTGFAAGTVRYSARVGCYWLLVTDRFPPFGLAPHADADPVQVWVEESVRRSRLTVLARAPLAIPAWLVLYFLAIFAAMMAFAAWWAILVKGRLPHGMFEVMELCHRYQARVAAYSMLVVDAYPWFQAESGSRPAEWGMRTAVQPAPE